jgi:hypothetical protein
MTIRSNYCVVFIRFTNFRNPFLTADSGITNITFTPSGGRRLFHSRYMIPIAWHRLFMSYRNIINDIITTVIPLLLQNAGNMNNKLFPPSVLITTITELSSVMMALIAGSCAPRNSAFLPMTCFNAS